MTRPTFDSRWADGSGATRTEPNSGQKDSGFANREAPGAGFFNWLAWALFQWVAYLDGMLSGFLTNAGLPLASVGDSDTQLFDLARYLRMGLAVGTWLEVEAAQQFHGVTFCGDANPGRVVAVGNSGAIYYAEADEEFATWTAATGTSGELFSDVVYFGGGNLCAVGSGGSSKVYTSSDYGATWTAGSFATGAWTASALCWCDSLSLLVAVGTAGTIETSANGVTWSAVSVPGGYSAVAWNGSEVVAVGGSSARYSSDAVTWSSVASASGVTFSSVCWSGTQWIGVGSGGDIRARAQGASSWTAKTADASSTSDFYALVAVTNGLVALGAEGEVQTSYTGDVWHRERYTGGGDTFAAAAWGGGRVVAVGGYGSANTRVSLGAV